MAKQIGVANSVISNWENNINFPRGDYVFLLANVFNVTTDYLLGYESDILHELKPDQSEDELLLLRAYRQMSEGKKRALFQMLDLDENVITHAKKTS